MVRINIIMDCFGWLWGIRDVRWKEYFQRGGPSKEIYIILICKISYLSKALDGLCPASIL